MNVTIPDDILQSAKLSADDLKLEIAILLYKQKRISIGQACRIAETHVIEFQRELSKRDLYINYEVEDFEADLKSLQELGDL